MHVTAIGNEKNIADLVVRLYGKASKTKAAAAADALLKANPQLGAGTDLKKGVALVVPELPDLALGKESAASGPAEQLAQNAAMALAAFRTHLSAAAKAEAANTAAEAKLMKTAAVKRLIQKMPAPKEQARIVNEAIKTRQAQTRSVQSIADKRIAAFAKSLAPTPPKPPS